MKPVKSNIADYRFKLQAHYLGFIYTVTNYIQLFQDESK